MNDCKGLLFDLDGVLVDTAKYHYLAWKALADELGVPFAQRDNERLKGVSRMASFEILLELGGLSMTQAQKEANCAKKNALYVAYIEKLTQRELLPGARDFLAGARADGYKTALGSASKNSPLILERLGITQLFDAVVDGNSVSRAKPDPEVFLQGARALGLAPAQCVVFEDAVAGIAAAHNGGMRAVGVGSPAILCEADLVVPGFAGLSARGLLARLSRREALCRSV